MLAAQQPLPAQELPGQQICPGPPQVLEVTVVAELLDDLPPLATEETPPLALPPLALPPPVLPAIAELTSPALPPEAGGMEDGVSPETPPLAPPPLAPPPPVSVLLSRSVEPPPPVTPPPLSPPPPVPASEELHADRATAHKRIVKDEATEDVFTVPCFSMLRLLDWRDSS